MIGSSLRERPQELTDAQDLTGLFEGDMFFEDEQDSDVELAPDILDLMAQFGEFTANAQLAGLLGSEEIGMIESLVIGLTRPVCRLTIPGRVPAKKNSKRIVPIKFRGRSTAKVLNSKAHDTWYASVKTQVQSEIRAVLAASNNSEPFNRPLLVVMTEYSIDSRKFDLSGKSETVQDMLTDLGFWADDNHDIAREVVLRYGGLDRVNPRVELKFYERFEAASEGGRP